MSLSNDQSRSQWGGGRGGGGKGGSCPPGPVEPDASSLWIIVTCNCLPF